MQRFDRYPVERVEPFDQLEQLKTLTADADKYTWLAWSGQFDEELGILDFSRYVTLDEVINGVLLSGNYSSIVIAQTINGAIVRSDYWVLTSQLDRLLDEAMRYKPAN